MERSTSTTFGQIEKWLKTSKIRKMKCSIFCWYGIRFYPYTIAGLHPLIYADLSEISSTWEACHVTMSQAHQGSDGNEKKTNKVGRRWAQMGAEWGLSWFIPGFSIPFSNWNWIKTMNPGIHDNLIICECEPDKIIIPAVGVEKNQLDRCFDKLFVEHNPLTDFYTYMQYIDDRIMSPS